MLVTKKSAIHTLLQIKILNINIIQQKSNKSNRFFIYLYVTFQTTLIYLYIDKYELKK